MLRFILAILLPWLQFFTIGRPVAGIICLILQLTIIAQQGRDGVLATAVGIATGGMASPLAFVGYAAGIVGTIGFYALLGRRAGR